MTEQETKTRLVDVLRRLAASPEQQISYLQQLGVAPSADELALELDDLMQLLPETIGLGMISPEAAGAVRRVDQYLEFMSGAEHAGLWSVDGLHSAEEWQEVRRLSALALQHFE